MHPTAVEASVPLGKKVRKGEDRNRKKSKSKSRKVSKSQRENQNSERSPPTLSTNTTPTFSGGSVDVTGMKMQFPFTYKNWNTLFCKNEPHFCLPVGKLMQVQPNYFWLNRSNFLANTYIVFVLHCAPQLQWGDAKISAITYKT